MADFPNPDALPKWGLRTTEDHTRYWEPDPFAPLGERRWEIQWYDRVRQRADELVTAYGTGQITRAQFEDDRHWGMRECLWRQHHGDQRRKNLGRPFWTVNAYLEWCENLDRIEPELRIASDGGYSLATVRRPDASGRERAFLRHEHVVPKKALIGHVLLHSLPVETMLWLNVCCVVTLEEDHRINARHQSAHPNPTQPWSRYEGLNISLLYNPDWLPETVEELHRHGLITHASVNARPSMKVSKRQPEDRRTREPTIGGTSVQKPPRARTAGTSVEIWKGALADLRSGSLTLADQAAVRCNFDTTSLPPANGPKAVEKFRKYARLLQRIRGGEPTVSSALSAGISRRDLVWDHTHGYITIEGFHAPQRDWSG